MAAALLTASPLSSLQAPRGAVRPCRARPAARSVRARAAAGSDAPAKTAPPTLEFQRERAKELTKFFKQQAFNAKINDSTTLGWTKSNEISNGRWVMFGLLVGMMTEYATGVDFPNQLKLTGSNWTASGGSFYNGNGAPITSPGPYFSAVAANTHGYNANYYNGHGVPVSNPGAYYSAVASNKYGYSSKK